jgi:hypothetical protein
LFYATPGRRIYPEQPIPFSHQLHGRQRPSIATIATPMWGVRIHPGLPPVEKCLHCHNYIIANHPQIQKNTTTTTATHPRRGLRYINWPNMCCSTTSAISEKKSPANPATDEVQQMDRLKGKRFYMGFCIECHREKKVNLGCWLACHS